MTLVTWENRRPAPPRTDCYHMTECGHVATVEIDRVVHYSDGPTRRHPNIRYCDGHTAEIIDCDPDLVAARAASVLTKTGIVAFYLHPSAVALAEPRIHNDQPVQTVSLDRVHNEWFTVAGPIGTQPINGHQLAYLISHILKAHQPA